MAADEVDGFQYDGSYIFSWVSDISGLPLDQVNFFVSQLLGLLLAPVFQYVLHPSTTSPATRHTFGMVMGLAFGYLCFGIQALHLAGLPAICYIVMRTQNPKTMQRVVMAVSISYLSFIHLHRQMYDYGSYTLDITGPLMVITQKVTSLAFSIHDGMTKKEEELTQLQKSHAVRKIPNPLEYFSFMFHYQALMAGPMVFYVDYIDFINGTNFLKHSPPQNGSLDRNSNSRKVVIEPSPFPMVFQKVILSFVCISLFMYLMPMFTISRVKEDEFIGNKGMVSMMMYLIVATSVARLKYYYAWLLADGICNASGLGFNGYDPETGKPRWDLISNVDILGFEFGLNIRSSIEAWNKGTTRWLRLVLFERAPKSYSTVLTYTLSALWHGFYPGYYLTFFGGALFTFAARQVRRSVRDYFLDSKQLKAFYDVITMITSRLTMAYVTFPFILLEFYPSIRIYLHMYLWLHVLALFAIFVLPTICPKRIKEAPIKSEKIESNGSLALMPDMLDSIDCKMKSPKSL
ncbi:lysophospholipid acyltransferase 6 [Hetaerina americana]|uniref:lysophospholipid acyltransferase 6 n=1 Tax=Hetaerina americana TaxID=62018 RepID=UPI003A7F4C8E